jgi:hypothetical protein
VLLGMFVLVGANTVRQAGRRLATTDQARGGRVSEADQ